MNERIYMHSVALRRHAFSFHAHGEAAAIKTQRQHAIRELLGSTPVGSQDELRRKLATQGFHVTQATLSRDIRELKLVKGPAGYALPDGAGLDEEEDDDVLPAIAEMLVSFGLEVRQAQNLLVLLTVKGAAQPVAAGIDDEEWSEVVGTVAGDNAVLIVCPDAGVAAVLKTRLETFIG